MNRREFLKATAVIPVLPVGCSSLRGTSRKRPSAGPPARRVRPGDPGWPSAAQWEALRRDVGGRLVDVKSPLAECRAAPDPAACDEVLRRLKNPYYTGDEPGLTQTTGWVDAWMSAPSAYAVAARSARDVVAAVNFAREHSLRLVVKGGGHSYQGTCSAPDSLLVWTRAMNGIELHDGFAPRGRAGRLRPQPAVTVGAGAVWMQAYDAVTTKGGRYVQGGGCTTVGVAGLIQSGGFGSFSKRYGLAAAGLLEAEVVTADGQVRVANAATHPDLFWGLKGGGGGSLGVVTRVTLRTRELPEYFGGAFGTIRARSDAAFRQLVARVVRFYAESMFNPHWGEQIALRPSNQVRVGMVFQGLSRQQAADVWKPLLDGIAAAPDDFSVEQPVTIVDVPARHLWDARAIRQAAPALIVSDDRPGAPQRNVFWAGDAEQAGQVLHGYRSAWLPASLLRPDRQPQLVDALLGASRHWPVSLHFNKGLAGAPAEEVDAARDTATNPAVLEAFALAIIAGGGPPAFPGIPAHEPDVAAARRDARQINAAMDALLKAATGSTGSYVSESDYFERSWQDSFWGPNYARLAAVKQKYDPDGLFFVHHGVGSEQWSADGFTRLPGR
jgi:FAD/FMN-containing dehydrogenase